MPSDAENRTGAADVEALRKERDALWDALSEMNVWFGRYPEFIPHPDALPKVEAAIKRMQQLLVLP